jgi:NADPH:quinone reductase-like Zn-dependent oxidoreductase
MEQQMTQLVAHSSRHQDHLDGDDRQTWPTGPGEIVVRVQACGPNRVDHRPSTGARSQLSERGDPSISGIGVAGTVIATGDRVTRFAVGDEVFGHFRADSWTWVQAPCARTTDGAHIELRPEGLDPLAAAALAGAGLAATTLLRAAEPQPGETAVLVGATSEAGTVLVPLLTEAGVPVTAGATPEDDAYVRSLGAAETFEYTSADPLADALASHPNVELLVDLITFGEPYFITEAAPHGTIVTVLPATHEPGIGVPRIGISAEPGDLAALAQRALEGRQPVEIAPRLPARKIDQARRVAATPSAQPALALADTA